MKRILLSFVVSALSVTALVAQNKLILPEVDGFHLLKGDMHIHTRFSDGNVWPTSRIDEAYLEGIDVYCVTEHVDERHKHMVRAGLFNCDRNEAYRIASAHAKKYGIIVVPGGEITRGMPPGHFNTLFLTDVEPVAAASDAEKDHYKGMKAGLTEAKNQGSFNVWNHPHWSAQNPNATTWFPEHEKIYDKGLMDGIEIYNLCDGYSPEAHQWAIDRNLTLIGATDSHRPMAIDINFNAGVRRPCTLIFAKERSVEGVREALLARRTAVYGDDMVYGSEELLTMLAKSCLEVTEVRNSGRHCKVTITNRSNMPVTLKKAPGSENVEYTRFKILHPFESITFSVGGVEYYKQPISLDEFDLSFYLDNFHTAPGTPLLYRIHIVRPH